MEDYYVYYTKSQKNDSEKKVFEKIQDSLRKQIVKVFKEDFRFKTIDKNELIREDILKIITPEEKPIIDEFHDFTTYLTGFHENRKNMYSAEVKSSAIAYRLIHENLPKFIDNISTFQKILRSPVKSCLEQLFKEMKVQFIPRIALRFC